VRGKDYMCPSRWNIGEINLAVGRKEHRMELREGHCFSIAALKGLYV
jgi:hypothetical protein